MKIYVYSGDIFIQQVLWHPDEGILMKSDIWLSSWYNFTSIAYCAIVNVILSSKSIRLAVTLLLYSMYQYRHTQFISDILTAIWILLISWWTNGGSLYPVSMLRLVRHPTPGTRQYIKLWTRSPMIMSVFEIWSYKLTLLQISNINIQYNKVWYNTIPHV